MIVKDEATLKQLINLHTNIKRGASNKTAMLVKYYMDGCPACINFQDEWNKAARTSPHKHVQFVKLNANMMERSPLPPTNGFPTVRIITASGAHTFDEERTAEKLLGFILKHSGKKARSNSKSRRLRKRKKKTRKRPHIGGSCCNRRRRGGGSRRKHRSFK
jgi:hypothetical protein